MRQFRFSFFLAAVIVIVAGKAQTKNSSVLASNHKNSLTDLIVYDVMIYNESVISMDTAQHKNLRDYEGYSIEEYNAMNEHSFLSTAQGRFFRQQLKNLLRNPSVVFFRNNYLVSGDLLGEAITREVFIQQFDSLGEATEIKSIRDTIDLKKWSKITFYEEWNLNSSSGAMEKKVLAYSFSYYDYEREFWRPILGIAADKPAFEKIRSEYLDAD
jgi:hypothetical protein